ncbi:MAG: SRPBCC family protein [Candidatus Aminicenantes bacterium]|jgi:ligand-binding SRPBCC domain-containing protein
MKKRSHILERETFIPSSIDEVFDFFSRAENLNRITPPWLHFKIRTDTPIHMEKGTFIDYGLRLKGLPVRWRSQITGWDPPLSFEDTQIKGPYKTWIHHHRFRRENGGTVMRDSVEYVVPGGILEPLIHFFVRRDLERIFDYRECSLIKIFTAQET